MDFRPGPAIDLLLDLKGASLILRMYTLKELPLFARTKIAATV